VRALPESELDGTVRPPEGDAVDADPCRLGLFGGLKRLQTAKILRPVRLEDDHRGQIMAPFAVDSLLLKGCHRELYCGRESLAKRRSSLRREGSQAVDDRLTIARRDDDDARPIAEGDDSDLEALRQPDDELAHRRDRRVEAR